MKKKEITDKIVVRGARTHNLKNIDVEMPRNKMVVISGMSGSGKSSLAFDTIFAEGQRRYVESLSAYARQFLNQMPKPDVDEITGLSPAISIDQKSRSNNPRSTVATITEIYDYLRVLYARIGKPFCPDCGAEIKKLSTEEIVAFVLSKVDTLIKNGSGKKSVMGVSWHDTAVTIFSPLVRGRKGEHYQLLYDLLAKGYGEIRLDGTLHSLREQVMLSKNKPHNIDVLVDQFRIEEFKSDKVASRQRLSEAVERALTESEGLVSIRFGDERESNENEFLLSAKFACPNDGYSFPEIEPRLFSFNSPYGACQTCNGLGTKYFAGEDVCESCHGARLRTEAQHVYLKTKQTSHKDKKSKTTKDEVGSIHGINIINFTHLSIADAYNLIGSLDLSEKDQEISVPVVREIEDRLKFMLDVGLEYLSLDRRANTLSGGESQRIRLASQLGSRLVGALYVLDEPTIGLHQKDNEKLIETLLNLRDLGNTILVVEHDEDTIYSADYLIDIGPKAGVHGGNVVVSGWLEDLLAAKKNESGSRTLSYLRNETRIEIPEERRIKDKGSIKIINGNIFNIKNLNVDVPLGRLVTITGVSGSGKSSFMYEILHKNLQGRLERKYRTNEKYNCGAFTGAEHLSRTILIDQSPIGRTPRSNIATYTGAFTFIRDMFASTNDARMKGWKSNRFSFNVKGGRCEACEGNGEIAVEMHFLPTVYVTCDICRGKRFDKETLTVEYKKKNIYQVLQMTVEEAIEFFKDIPAIYDRLKTLEDVGLGYLALGQSATTLSGGEAQRVKIASELYRPHVEKTMYLLDEPTVGLHYDDVSRLISVLDLLVSKGNTVVVIEHNMDLIKCSDYIIDIGPLGGINGGQLVAKGTPEEVANNKNSYTGQYLKKVLRKK
jgi:excinuclease ABC subunit A